MPIGGHLKGGGGKNKILTKKLITYHHCDCLMIFHDTTSEGQNFVSKLHEPKLKEID